jgi:hypothetical protein
MDEVPNGTIIDLEAACGELADKSPQRKVPLSNPVPQPHLMLAPDRLWLVPAHLARRHASRFLETPHPVDRRTHSDAEARGRLMPRQTLLFNRGNNPFAKIH